MDKDLDRPVTVRELLVVLEEYHNAIADLSSCMINASSGLRLSGVNEAEKEGDQIFHKLDSVISSLEKASEKLQALTSKVEQN